jgi:hypothetical protein
MTNSGTTAANLGTIRAPQAEDVPAVLAQCHARLLEREGIAMFVALDDVRPDQTVRVTDADALTEGARAAELLDGYYARMEATGFPAPDTSEPDKTGAKELIDALVVLSEVHLRARIEHQEETA